MRLVIVLLFAPLSSAVAEMRAPKIWDDNALADWATPIAAIGMRPEHFKSEEYYRVPGENLKTYPVYHPDREPPGYWEWLQKQTPQPLVDAKKLRTRQDWIRAGEVAFGELDEPRFRTFDPARILQARDRGRYDGIWTHADGSLFILRWVVTDRGLGLSVQACAACHGRVQANGRVLWGAPEAAPPAGFKSYIPVPMNLRNNAKTDPFRGDSWGMWVWRGFTVPWAPDERVERIKDLTDGEARRFLSALPEVFPRIHGSPFYMTKIPDLNVIRHSRYIDATGTHRLRGPEDIARYAALVTGSDTMQFGHHRIATDEQRRVSHRFADEVLYAMATYLMSLEPPRNPDVAPRALVDRGRGIFKRETCINCHVPPNYTSGKLTLAQGYTAPANHPNKADILNISVGTDPGLALKTRKGTGFYKIPSLRGLWYRPLLLHDGSVASLEEMFDPARLKSDHVPGGWKGPGVTNRAIPGHPFALNLTAKDKAALLAFLRSL